MIDHGSCEDEHTCTAPLVKKPCIFARLVHGH
jgi:hypothetical protein